MFFRKNQIFFIVIGIIVAGLSSCGKQTCSCLTISPPDITLTGPKTSVERQIIGEYKELEKDAWLVSSARSGETQASGRAGSRAGREIKIFRSFAVLENNREKLQDYEKRGIIGENNKGYVEKVSTDLDKEQSAKLDIDNLIKTVNNARKSLFLSLLQDAKELNLSMEDIGKIFSEKYKQSAPLGTKVQLTTGKWLKKK